MIKRYKIAGLVTEVEFFNSILEKQGVDYEYDGNEPCVIKIKVPDDFLENQIKENPHLTPDEIEYIWTGYDFNRKILKHGVFVLHSSAVVYNGYAYLFSADCGTGKSTHTSFWQKNFGENNARILNDDKPLILKQNDVFCASGSPWSGKTDKNINICVPIAGVALLNRSETNSISPITSLQAFTELYSQTYRPSSVEDVDILLALFNDFLASSKFYRLKCNMSCEAAQTAYDAMKPLHN
ncbi:MAG: hypothetical protein IJO74_05760 [Clostridia bacterium]|nr:hypothetical protein [Clostridia bacterium]